MPYLQIRVSCPVQEEQQVAIKNELSPKITLLPGKSENRFMLEIIGSCNLYFGGNKEDTNAYCNLCINAPIDTEALEIYSKEICKTLHNILDISYSNIFITHQVYTPWMWGETIMKE